MGEGEAGTVGGQAGDRESGSRGSELSSGSTQLTHQLPRLQPGAGHSHSSSHVALGVLGPPGVPGDSMHRLLHDMGQGNFQPLKARQQWETGFS